MSRISSPSLDVCFAKLIREEQRYVNQIVIEQKHNQVSNPLEVACLG